jgi:hypothetical protein
MVSVRVIVPLKLLSGVRVMLDVADWPASVAVGEVAVIVKFWKTKRAVAMWTRGVLVPVIVMV